MAQVTEKKIIVQEVIIRNENQDLLLQFEQSLVLLGNPELFGFLSSLILLNQIGYIHFKTQKQLAEKIGFSEPTFISKRKKLEELGLIEIVDKGRRRIVNLKNLSRLKNFKLPTNLDEQSKYIDNSRHFIIESAKNEASKDPKSDLSDNIYIYNTNKSNIINNNNNNINNNINNNTESINNNNVIAKEKKETFLREDYNLILEAYKKYKGVELMGPEIAYHMRAIKMMFQAMHKVQEIINFMKWLHDNQNNEETSWVRTWTIWTVQKKINEFVAGKLKVGKSLDEEYPEYGK